MISKTCGDDPARGVAPRPVRRGGVDAGRRRPPSRQRRPNRSRLPLKVKAKSVIQIFLWGGMSHNDTWDPKPDSGRDYMGEFAKVIPTNVHGDPDRRAVSRCWPNRPTSSRSSAA